MKYSVALLRQRNKQGLVIHSIWTLVETVAQHCMVSKLSNYKVTIQTKVNRYRQLIHPRGVSVQNHIPVPNGNVVTVKQGPVYFVGTSDMLSTLWQMHGDQN